MSVDRDEYYMTKLYISNKPEVKKKYISPLIESYEYDDVDGELLVVSPNASAGGQGGDGSVSNDDEEIIDNAKGFGTVGGGYSFFEDYD